MSDIPTNAEIDGLNEKCNIEAYKDFRNMGGDHIGAEQYGCAYAMRTEAETVIRDVFSRRKDLDSDRDAEVHIGRIAERIYTQSTNVMRILRESLYEEPDDPDKKDNWD